MCIRDSHWAAVGALGPRAFCGGRASSSGPSAPAAPAEAGTAPTAAPSGAWLAGPPPEEEPAPAELSE
eukprot:4765407-Alexandrium_andersonii.AAC.1